MAPPTDNKEKLHSLGIEEGKTFGGKWTITKKLAEGGFGSIFKVQNIENPKLLGALKVELNRPNKPNHMKLETLVFKDLHSEGISHHVPMLYRAGKTKDYYYMILSLLGPNLYAVTQLEAVMDERFALKDMIRLAIQSLYAVKTVHDHGYIHRDIKPANFVLGHPDVPAVARLVHIIDFGLSRAFAYPPPPNSPPGSPWLARRARSSIRRFRGTWRFASPMMHEKKEQGRRDDIWSWLYTMMDLYCELPWSHDYDDRPVQVKKVFVSDADLMIKMPTELQFIPEYLRTLTVYSRPDYYRIFDALDRVRQNCKVTFLDHYTWEEETSDANKEALQLMQPQPGYMKAGGFFIWDPLHINGPPTAKDEEEVKERPAKKSKNSTEDAKRKKKYPMSPYSRSMSEKSSDFKPASNGNSPVPK